MNEQEPEKPQRQFSMPALIAWLSLCLLTAAWGQTVDSRWQWYWSIAGTFGLVAATGLGSLEKLRISRKKWIQERATRLVTEERLAHLNEHHSALASINKAIDRLTAHAAMERKKQGLSKSVSGKEAQVLSQYPLEIIPIKEIGDSVEVGFGRSVAGSLRKISSSAVSFEHGQPFPEQIVLLTFGMDKPRQMCFVVDVIHSQESNGSFTSSGAVMTVGKPAWTASELNPTESVVFA